MAKTDPCRSGSAFHRAAEEIDSLSLKGYFGEEVKQLVDRRSSMRTPDFLALCVEEWIERDDQYGREQVIDLIGVFFLLYLDSIRESGQTAVDCLTYFLKGFPENPDTESLGAFLELISSFREIRGIARQVLNRAEITDELRIRLGREVSRAYQKSVEFLNKMLTILLLLLDPPEEPSKVSFATFGKPLAWKVKRFLKLSRGRFDGILENVDREIRNAESHLDMRYSVSEGAFVYKVRRGGQTKTREIPAEGLFLKLLSLGLVIQAFIYSGSLLVLAGTRPDRYRELVDRLLLIAPY